MQSADSGYPVRFEVDYPEAPSKGLALLGVLFLIKGLLLIPHIIVLYVLGIVGFIVFYIGYWAVLITGRYPQGLFAFVVGVQRWSTRTDSWMYGEVDRYPPFSLSAVDYPARFEVDYPEAPSRGLALLGVLFLIKGLLLIPHIIVLYVLGIVGFIVFYIGYWAVLITGRYPQGLFAFVVGVQRWSTRTDSWMYGEVDRYPPFSLSAVDYPARFDVDYPEAPSRGLALLGVLFLIKLILLIPHLIILYALGLVSFVVVYIGYWAVLITGRYPRGLFDLVVGVQRWSYRANAWFLGLTDRYPPFTLSS